MDVSTDTYICSYCGSDKKVHLKHSCRVFASASDIFHDNDRREHFSEKCQKIAKAILLKQSAAVKYTDLLVDDIADTLRSDDLNDDIMNKIDKNLPASKRIDTFWDLKEDFVERYAEKHGVYYYPSMVVLLDDEKLASKVFSPENEHRYKTGRQVRLG